MTELNLNELLVEETCISMLMENREKGDTKDLIGKKVTINDIDFCELPNDDGEPEQQIVYTIKEESDKFYFGGFVIKKYFNTALSKLLGDVSKLRELVRKQGVRMEFGQQKTKDGKRTVTTIKNW